MTNIAATKENLAKRDKKKTNCKLYLSCESSVEMCTHILTCPEEGRVELLMETIKNLELWMRSAETDPILVDCIGEYARGRGGKSMQEVCRSHHTRYRKLGQSQDNIGWRRFMEGCISKEVIQLQLEFAKVHGMKMSMANWASGLITKLLEVTHGQWIYRNLLVHEKPRES